MSSSIIDEKLECPICQDMFVDACETSCGHGFCEFCLNSCLEQKPGICPVCQKNPSPIHPSFILRSLVDCLRGVPAEAPPGTVATEKAEGNNCYNLKKYAEAIVHYSLALQKDGSDALTKAVLHANRAQCYIKLEEYRRALDDCDESIRLDPTGDVKAHMRRGHCLYRLGYLTNSREAYEQAKRLDTTNKWREAIDEALMSLPIDPSLRNPFLQQQQYPPQAAPRPQMYTPPPSHARQAQQTQRPAHPAYPGHYAGQQNAGPVPRPVNVPPANTRPAVPPQNSSNPSGGEGRPNNNNEHNRDCVVQ